MNILGIHYGHNATIALLQDGKITFACSEERFNRIKNSKGYPVLALEHLYNNIINPEKIDLVVMFQKNYSGYLDLKRNNFISIRDSFKRTNGSRKLYSFKDHVYFKLKFYKIRSIVGKILTKIRTQKDLKTGESLNYFSKMARVPKEKIIFSDHHFSHAYASCSNLDPNKKTLIFTMDGEGDGLSSTVNEYSHYKMKRLSSNPVSVSLGYFYSEITKLLGMIPNEHEFKVMGMAPYAKKERAKKLYEQFKDLIILNKNLEFESNIPMNRLSYYFLEKMYGERFDTIMAFAQLFLEQKVLEWVRAWVNKTGISNLALGGGVFMNVKLSQKIVELDFVDSLYVFPSGGDESTAIGAAYYGYIKTCQDKGEEIKLKPLTDLYLGMDYTDEYIGKFLKEKGFFEKYNIEFFENDGEIEKKTAELLSKNNIVARCSGPMEWGARALGNRSILANASSKNVVKVINEMIKNRDFWMPFATSIIEDDVDRYLLKYETPAPYMCITFDTTELARDHLAAAIHPYDLTSRPQVVNKEWSPLYYLLIKEYKELTGMGGILNTSFNLHGEPNVNDPNDAIYVFENSGLLFLALGKYLISKNMNLCK